MNRYIQHALPLLFVLILTSCSSTKLVNSWNAKDHTGPAFKKVLVIGISNQAAERRSFEQQFATKLSNRPGVVGVESSTLLPSAKEIKKETIVAAIKDTNIDAVLITHLVIEKKQKRYVPPQTNFVPTAGYGLYDHYYATHRMVYTPGYTTVDTIVKLETNVYSAASEKLVWTGTTESFNAGSANKIIDELANIVISQLAGHKLL